MTSFAYKLFLMIGAGLHVQLKARRRNAFVDATAAVLMVCMAARLSKWRQCANMTSRIVWTRGEIERCTEAKCLERSPLSELITEQEAKKSMRLMASLIRKKHIGSAPPALFQGRRLVTCAVVGGAPLDEHIRRREQAKLVEEADATIRFNIRYPRFRKAGGGSEMLGRTTHVLVVQRGALRYLKKLMYGWGQGNGTLGKERREAFESLRDEAPVILCRHECPGHFRACVQGWESLQDSRATGALDVHLVHPELEASAYKLLARFKAAGAHSVPTTGMIGVAMALRHCRTVQVFAMNGSTRVSAGEKDAPVWRGHDLRAERLFIRAAARNGAVQILS